jgi:hypothetical protein
LAESINPVMLCKNKNRINRLKHSNDKPFIYSFEKRSEVALSITQINTYEISCDNHPCTNCIIIKSYNELKYVKLSEGWNYYKEYFYDCGLTGYSTSKRRDLCPSCWTERLSTNKAARLSEGWLETEKQLPEHMRWIEWLATDDFSSTERQSGYFNAGTKEWTIGGKRYGGSPITIKYVPNVWRPAEKRDWDEY